MSLLNLSLLSNAELGVIGKIVNDRIQDEPEHFPLSPLVVCDFKKIESNKLIETNYKCDKCSKEFHKVSAFNLHFVTHFEKDICSICNQFFYNQELLKQHLKEHTSQVEYQCDFCQKEFQSISFLTVHQSIIHHDLDFTCKRCLKKFNDFSSYKLHVKEQHEYQYYYCKKCATVFEFDITFAWHMKNVHPDQTKKKKIKKKQRCNICNKDISNLKRHLATHINN